MQSNADLTKEEAKRDESPTVDWNDIESVDSSSVSLSDNESAV